MPALRWSSSDEHRLWRGIEQEIHERNVVGHKSLYIWLQTFIESFAHQAIAEASAPGRRILEIGVGGGEHVAFEKMEDRQYVGIDIVFDYAKITQGAMLVAVADAASLPFPSNHFDCVIAFGVIEHVQAIDRVVREIKRVIAPGGSLLVLIPPNGGVMVGLVKLLLTYPTMFWRGIKRPDLIWNYQNANSFKRVMATLGTHFTIAESFAVPFYFLPWRLALLWFFKCVRT
jgi:SAM-dependent methyltransferase